MKKNWASILIIVVVLLIALEIYFQFSIDIIQKVFSIFGSLSLVLALYSYFYKKRQDETLAAIEQIAFFREKIIYEWSDVSEQIKKECPRYGFSRIRFTKNRYFIEDIQKDFSHNLKNQIDIFFEISTVEPIKIVIKPILSKQVYLLNMLEEFALRVRHFNTQQNNALDAVHATFIELVEKNAGAIVFMRDIMTNNPSYSNILFLYDLWQNKVNTSNLINNLEKHGFLTKDQKREILKKQRENRSS